MDRWTAPSSDDYYDHLNGPYHTGTVKRICAHCGRDVWVDKSEQLPIQIWCDRCQQKEAKQ